MTSATRDRFVHKIFTTVAPYVDTLTHTFSLGMDHYWRKRAVALSGIKRGDRVLDVCAGTGELSFILARTVGNDGSIVGSDFCENMLALARKKLDDRYANITFLLADTKKVPFPDNSFDAVTVAFGMRNIPDTVLALKEIRRVLKPEGKFLCLELTRPHNRWFLAVYKWYIFRVMPFISNLVMKTAEPFLYLPRSIEEFYQPAVFQEIIVKNGFSNVAVDSMTMGIATVYRANKLP
jgi:demethylmenaquinone methyltransferase/2-methoxy-6-polyprenyl-1,4-benzoquinol methylase